MRFEEWFAKTVGSDGMARMLIDTGLVPAEAILEAYSEGVRESDDVAIDLMLHDPGIVRMGDFMSQPWYSEVMSAPTAEEMFDRIVAHGVVQAPCCEGNNEHCEFQQGINAAIVRQEHHS